MKLYKCLLLQLAPQDAEEYIDYLVSIGRLDEAAQKYATIINDPTFVSKKGKSKHQVSRFVHSVRK